MRQLLDVFDGDALQLKAGAEEQCAAAEEGAGWKLAFEVGEIHGVKALPQRDIAAEDLELNEIVHPHSSQSEDASKILHDQMRFFFGGFGNLEFSWNKANATGEVEGFAIDKNSVGEGHFRIAAEILPGHRTSYI